MPFLPFNRFNEEDENNNQNQNISGQSTVVNPAQNANNTPAAPKPQKQSGSWTNINQYLDANKEQTASMADNLSQDVTSKAQDAQSKVQSYQNATPGTVQAKSENDLKSIYDNALTANKTDYTKLKSTGGYEGPSSYDKVEGYEDANQAWNKANQAVENTATEVGRQNLLSDYYKRPTYSRGQNVLDQSLIQRDDYAKDKIQGVKNQFSDINSWLDNATTQAGNKINQNLQTASANKQLVNQSEENYLKQFQDSINDRAKTQKQEQNAKYGSVTQDITDDSLDADTLSMLGLGNGANIYDLDLSAYLNPYSDVNINSQSVANADEYAKYKALSNLMDRDPTFLNDETLANTANRVGFNKDQLSKDLATKKQAIDNHLATVGSLYTVGTGGTPKSVEDVQRTISNMEAAARQNPQLLPVLNSPSTHEGRMYSEYKQFLAQLEALKPNRTIKQN